MKTVFFDVDTQFDFLAPAGALYVPDAERIIPAVAMLNRFAAANGIPVVSTTDAHAEDDPEFAVWPPHCIAGTLGQRKLDATLLESRVVVPNRAATVRECNPELSLAGFQQIIAEKQTVDVFQSAAVRDVVDRLNADRYVVYGVVTEICVLFAARGLLATGKPVSVVTDAIETLRAQDSSRALEEIVVAGGTLTSARQVCG